MYIADDCGDGRRFCCGLLSGVKKRAPFCSSGVPALAAVFVRIECRSVAVVFCYRSGKGESYAQGGYTLMGEGGRALYSMANGGVRVALQGHFLTSPPQIIRGSDKAEPTRFDSPMHRAGVVRDVSMTFDQLASASSRTRTRLQRSARRRR